MNLVLAVVLKATVVPGVSENLGWSQSGELPGVISEGIAIMLHSPDALRPLGKWGIQILTVK